MRCSPSRNCGLGEWGGAGLWPCRGSGVEGVREGGCAPLALGGGRGGGAESRGPPPPRYPSRGYGGAEKPPPWGRAGVLAYCAPPLARWGGGGGGAREEGGGGTAASAVGLPSDNTPGSGCGDHDPHPAAPPPRRHELVDREPRRSVGVAPRAGVLVLLGWLERPRGWHHRIPHGEYPRDGGQHCGSGRVRVPGRGEGPVAPEEAPDGAAVGDAHPMAPGAFYFVVPPLVQEHPALGRVGRAPRGAFSGVAGREGTEFPEGRQQGGDLGQLRALPPMEAVGPPEWGRPAIPPAEGLVERGARHRTAPRDALQGRQPPPGVHACVHLVEEAFYEDVLHVEKVGGRPLEGVERVGDGREGPFRALVARG